MNKTAFCGVEFIVCMSFAALRDTRKAVTQLQRPLAPAYPASRGPSIFLDKSGRGRAPARRVAPTVLFGY